jgi:hypothetical protein
MSDKSAAQSVDGLYPLPLGWGQAFYTFHRDALLELLRRRRAAQPPDGVTEPGGAVQHVGDGVDVVAAMMMLGGVAQAGQHSLADDRPAFGDQALQQGFGGVGGLCFHGDRIVLPE